MTTEAPPAKPTAVPPTKDERFLHGVDLDSPAQMGRSIAMQIRTVGHYQGKYAFGCAFTACVVASAAFAKANSDQRERFEEAVRRHAGLPGRGAAGLSLVWWNDTTPTERVVEVLETLPFPDPPAEGTCDR